MNTAPASPTPTQHNQCFGSGGLAERFILRLSEMGILLAALGTVGVAAWLILSSLPNVRGVENNVVFSIQQILLGRPLYSSPAEFPFSIAQYSPAYYYLCAAVAKVTGVGPHDIARLYTVTRGISFALELARLVLAYVVLRRMLKVERRMSLLACALIFVCTAPWSFVARPDSLVALCVLGATVCVLQMFARAQTSARAANGFLAGAVLLGCVATMAKQSGFSFFLILFSFLFFTREWKRLFLGCGIALVGGLACLLLAGLGGPDVKGNIIDGVRNGVDYIDAFTRTYFPFLSTMVPILGLSVLIALKWLRPGAGRPQQFLAYSMVLLLAQALAQGLKTGSQSQYFNDYLAVAVLSACYFFQSSAKLDWENPRRSPDSLLFCQVSIACLLLPYLGDHLFTSVYRPLTRKLDGGTLAERQAAADLLQTELKAHPGTFVLSLDGVMDSLIPDRCVLPHKDVHLLSHERGLVDYSNFKGLIQSGRVRYVVAANEILPQSVVGVTLTNYVPLKTCGKYTVYRWNSEPAPAAPIP